MKTRFVKAAVLMLAISLLAVAASFTVTAVETPSDVFADNWSLSAYEQTVAPGQDVTIYLVADKSLFCDGIAGSWDLEDTTHNVQLVRDTNNTGLVINPAVIVDSEDLNKKTPNYVYPIIGEFMWVNSIDSTQGKGSFAAGDWIVKAVYTVSKNAPDGEYVINFTKTVYAGLGQVDESEETLSITIKVQHVCEPSETLVYDKYYHWQVCAQCSEMIGSKASHQYTSSDSDENYHWSVCACGATTTKFPHTSVEYEVDETGHIGVCSCGAKGTKQDHYVSEYGAKDEHEHTGICICKYELTEEHTYDQEGLCACGAVKPVTNVDVEYKGEALATAYTVEGQTVTVTYSAACKVGYWNETEGKYVALTATEVSENTYSFTVPAGVTEVLLVIKGDVDGNGTVAVLDRVTVSRALLDPGTNGYIALNDWQLFTADVDENGTVAVLDRVTVSRALLDPGTNGYLKFDW